MRQIIERIPHYLALVGGLLFCVFVGFLVSGYYGNPLSALAPALAGLLMVYASVNYRKGLFCLVVLTGYLDLVKRILLYYGEITFSDIASVLAVAPILTGGMFLGCYLPLGFLRLRKVVGIELRLFILASIFISFFVASTWLNTEGISETIQNTGQAGVYIFMIPIAYSLFAAAPLDFYRRFFRFMLIVFIPVGCYGLWQLAFGYSNIEIDYMNSGFTQTVDLLLTNQLRPFSTVNSPQAYGTLMYFLMVLALYNARTSASLRPLWLCVFGFYLIADFLSTQRGPVITSIATVTSMYWFTSKTKTITIYACGVAVTLLIILNSAWLIDNLLWLDSLIPRTSDIGFQGQMFSIGTFKDRLEGFTNVLTSPESWTWFGDPKYDWRTSQNRDTYNHDILSQLLLRFGVVGVIAILVPAVSLLVVIHRRVYRVQDEDRRKLAALLLNLVAMFLFLNMIGKGFQIFPLNTYIYLFVGLTVALCYPPKEEEAVSQMFSPKGQYMPTRHAMASGMGMSPRRPA